MKDLVAWRGKGSLWERLFILETSEGHTAYFEDANPSWIGNKILRFTGKTLDEVIEEVVRQDSLANEEFTLYAEEG